MTKRGRVLRDTNAGPGLMTVEGVQYSFVLENMWRSEIPPRPGMPVEVTFGHDGIPEAVAAVSEAQASREQTQKAFSGALRHSEAVNSGLRKSGNAGRLGGGVLIAEFIMLLSFFLLPNLTVGSSYSTTPLSGWDATGLSAVTMSATDHGFLSLMAVVCLLAPLGMPFITQDWARLLNAAPFAFAAVAFAVLGARIEGASRIASRNMGNLLGTAAGREMGQQISGMFHVSIGAYLVLLCSIYLLTRAFRQTT